MAVNYNKYLYSTGTYYISNCGSDENGSYSGGKAGDQTGSEWTLKAWYSRPWDCVLRYPDQNVALLIAELAIEAALNDNIGYDQNERDTFWTQLQKAGYHPANITTPCEADCSSGVIAIVKAVGYLLGITALQNISATYTGNMKSAFKSAGFEVLTDSKYTTQTVYLLPGDVNLNESHHTATNVTVGSKATFTPSDTSESGTKTVDELAEEVIAGKWGNDPERSKNLTASGYDATAVQARVNELLGSTGSTSSSSTSSSSTSSGTTSSTDGNGIEYAESLKSGYSSGKSLKVTASSGLNMRKGAGTNKTIIKALSYGSKVTWYGYYTTVSGEKWYLVQDSTGQTGYCSSQYLA